MKTFSEAVITETRDTINLVMVERDVDKECKTIANELYDGSTKEHEKINSSIGGGGEESGYV